MQRTIAVGLTVLACLSLGVTTAAALDFPDLSGRVVDQADLLDDPMERYLTSLSAQHESVTSNQVVIVTLPSLQGTSIEDFGYQLGRHWEIGQAEADNGLLLIVAPNEKKVRIEVGYGLEGVMTDAIARTIIETEILPHFRAGDFQRGVADGAASIIAVLEGTSTYKPIEPVSTAQDDNLFNWVGTSAAIVFFVLIMLLLGIISLEPYRRGYFLYLKYVRGQSDLRFAWYEGWLAWRREAGYLRSKYYPVTASGPPDDGGPDFYSSGESSGSGFSIRSSSGGGFRVGGSRGGGFRGGGGGFGGGGASGGW